MRLETEPLCFPKTWDLFAAAEPIHRRCTPSVSLFAHQNWLGDAVMSLRAARAFKHGCQTLGLLSSLRESSKPSGNPSLHPSSSSRMQPLLSARVPAGFSLHGMRSLLRRLRRQFSRSSSAWEASKWAFFIRFSRSLVLAVYDHRTGQGIRETSDETGCERPRVSARRFQDRRTAEFQRGILSACGDGAKKPLPVSCQVGNVA